MNIDEFNKMNELLGLPKYEPPKIDMLILTEDSELADKLLSLNIEGANITPTVKQMAGISQEIVVIISYATALLGTIRLLLDVIKAHQDKKPNKTKAVIFSREQKVDIEGVVINYKDSVEIEIRDKE
jgi:hypothetical protein